MTVNLFKYIYLLTLEASFSLLTHYCLHCAIATLTPAQRGHAVNLTADQVLIGF